MWLMIAITLAILYVPLTPSLVASLKGTHAGEWSLQWYIELWRTPLIVNAARTTAIIAVFVSVIAPTLGLLAALSITELITASKCSPSSSAAA